MRPIITVTAVVLLHLCLIAVLVGVNGCRSTSGFEREGDLAAYSAGARPSTGGIATPIETRIATPAPSILTPLVAVGPGGKYTCIKGDTLVSVALQEKVTARALAEKNKLPLNAVLKPGQVLVIPAPAAVPTKTGTKSGTKTATKTATKSAPVVKASTAAPAAPTPTFAPLKIISLTNPQPEAAKVPATK